MEQQEIKRAQLKCNKCNSPREIAAAYLDCAANLFTVDIFVKPKQRMGWMSWHAIMACFFLPLLILYTVTGGLYMLDIKGSNSFEKSIPIQLEQKFPDNQAAAFTLINKHYDAEKYGPLKGEYFFYNDGHSWYHFDQEVFLAPTDSEHSAELQIQHHGVWKKLVFIHKGIANIGFWILGLALSASLLFSMISGVILAFTTPRYKKRATISLLSGCLIIIVAYFLPL